MPDSLENVLLLELDPVGTEQFEKFRLEILLHKIMNTAALSGRKMRTRRFHGFRVGGLRRTAAPPVATLLRPLRGPKTTHHYFTRQWQELPYKSVPGWE